MALDGSDERMSGIRVVAALALVAAPSAHPPSPARQAARMMLDRPLYLVDASRFRSTHDFLVKRLTMAIAP